MTALYLEGKTGLQVGWDFPALTVQSAEKTRQLFPLSRVSRVVVTGNVEWSMSALFACADAGISIVFLNDKGEVRCQWIGCVDKTTSVAQSFISLFQGIDAMQRYQNWLLAMQRMAIRSSARRCGIVDWQAAESDLFEQWLLQKLGKSWLSIRSRLQGYLQSSVSQYLTDFGFEPVKNILGDGDYNLVDDLTSMLLKDFYPALIVWRVRSHGLPDSMLVIRFYEQRKQRIEHLLRGLLNRLHQSLRGH